MKSKVKKLIDIINLALDKQPTPLTLMEVCGSHTAALAKNGIPELFRGKIQFLSGPGCPVCVTSTAYIDRLIELSHTPDHTVVTFGDLIRVPGSCGTLAESKSRGGNVQMVYSPFDVLHLAKSKPQINFVVAAIGFETTSPLYALLLDEIISEDIKNIKFLTSLKTMPKVIDELLKDNQTIDGIIAPGHVSVIIGSDAFSPIAKKYQLPFAVAGFESESLLTAIACLVKLKNQSRVINAYPSVVRPQGNYQAQKMIDQYFDQNDAFWRGLGKINGSGLVIKPKWSSYDLGSANLTDDQPENKFCHCPDVLRGKMSPIDCPLFKTTCSPENPQGACMVSEEGSCHTFYNYYAD